ncbi:cytochrome C [uncultured Salinisphaera sp.]|uniref:c-type cytochrome n=1 Tax=uncultured Salinisphaera sp. TaxID=359372 RepID=UPI0032B13C51
MIPNRQTIVVSLVALAGLGLATAAVGADDGPIVNDYSSMGAEYGYSGDSSKKDESQAADTSASKSSGSTHSREQAADDGELYQVDCAGSDCKVSKNVMVGYEKFGSHCAQCHAQNAEGSTFAPSLVKRLKGMNQGRFTAAVAGGVTRLDSTTGQYSVMPAWANNEDVMNNVQNIWAFLKARSDGELPAGRPKPMDDKS